VINNSLEARLQAKIDMGRDNNRTVLAIAATGSGKTTAYVHYFLLVFKAAHDV
jgi:superfamily II DNA/RNA helicase